jgi:hypothetical protein
MGVSMGGGRSILLGPPRSEMGVSHLGLRKMETGTVSVGG